MNSSRVIVLRISVSTRSLVKKTNSILKNQLSLVRDVIYSDYVLFLRNIYQRNSLISVVVGGAVVT